MKLMTHIVAGYPSLRESEELALAMSNASFIEIQIPFSDPVADGPTIMEANQIALKKGMTPEKSLQLMKKLKEKIKTPLLFMTYYNIAFSFGLEKFCKKCQEAGAYGLIIPDIPIDEEPYDHYLALCKKYNLHAIQVVSPITPKERLRKIGKIASGFVYCVSRFGTTGEINKLSKNIKSYLKEIRKYIKTPLALGFGISSKEQAVLASKYADIVVIGSKILNTYKEKGLKGVKKFLENITK